MKFTALDQLKALRYFNNLDAVEKSLYKEFELNHIDEIELTRMLHELTDQRRNLYKAMEAMSGNFIYKQDNLD